MIGANFRSRTRRKSSGLRGPAGHIDAKLFGQFLRLSRLEKIVGNFAMTGAGVPVGASIAYQTLASKPGSPASEAVGTSGKPAAPAASDSPAPLRSCRGQQERRRYQGAVQHAPDRTIEEDIHRNISLRDGSSVVGRQGRKSFRSMSPKLGGIALLKCARSWGASQPAWWRRSTIWCRPAGTLQNSGSTGGPAEVVGPCWCVQRIWGVHCTAACPASDGGSPQNPF
jgi:hypothetical protein